MQLFGRFTPGKLLLPLLGLPVPGALSPAAASEPGGSQVCLRFKRLLMNEIELTPAEQDRLDLFSRALSSWFATIQCQEEPGSRKPLPRDPALQAGNPPLRNGS